MRLHAKFSWTDVLSVLAAKHLQLFNLILPSDRQKDPYQQVMGLTANARSKAKTHLRPPSIWGQSPWKALKSGKKFHTQAGLTLIWRQGNLPSGRANMVTRLHLLWMMTAISCMYSHSCGNWCSAYQDILVDLCWPCQRIQVQTWMRGMQIDTLIYCTQCLLVADLRSCIWSVTFCSRLLKVCIACIDKHKSQPIFFCIKLWIYSCLQSSDWRFLWAYSEKVSTDRKAWPGGTSWWFHFITKVAINCAKGSSSAR